MNTIINDALVSLVKHFVAEQLPFTLIVDNHNNWDKPLPERLSSTTRFKLNVQNTDLSDSYIDKDGNIVITAGIDDIVYTKVLEACDIHSVGPLDKIDLVIKQFIEEPEVIATGLKLPIDTKHSMECLRKFNPEYFSKKLVKEESDA